MNNRTRHNKVTVTMGWLASIFEVVVALSAVVATMAAHEPLMALVATLVFLRLAILLTRWRFTRDRRANRYEALVRHSSDVIVIADPSGDVTYVSPSVDELVGRPASDLVGASVTSLLSSADQGRANALIALSQQRPGVVMSAEWNIGDANGRISQVEVLVRNLLDEPAVNGIVFNLRDVSERKELENRLVHQANHDGLTGLANRSLLRVRIEQALTKWLFQNEPFCLLVVDIDDFKAINDSFGHAAGDAVLTMLARRISGCIRQEDMVVRLNADEFAVLLEGVPGNDEEAHSVAERIIESIRKPMHVEGHEMALRASAGLACVTDQVSQADDILRNADIALHAAKSTTNESFVNFKVEMHDSTLKRLQLEADLRRAMEDDEFQLYYQPTVDMATGRLVGVEALLRWPHPERGFISPVDFIPVAEDSGSIIELGTWVLRQACFEMRKWQGRYPSVPHLKMNVNLSARQLHQPEIVETVRSAMEDSGIASGSLVLEITETVLTDDKPSTLAKMRELVAMGVQLAIDDFGTGYSALSYLREFPLAVLKIDRSFVSGVGHDGSDEQAGLVQAIIDLARTLRLKTVAEGIETQDQMDALRSMGCDTAQGFLLARPAPAEEVRRLIEATHAAGLPVPAATTA